MIVLLGKIASLAYMSWSLPSYLTNILPSARNLSLFEDASKFALNVGCWIMLYMDLYKSIPLLNSIVGICINIL